MVQDTGQPPVLLVAGWDAGIAEDVVRALRAAHGTAVRVLAALTVQAGLDLLHEQERDGGDVAAVVTAWRLPDAPGPELLERTAALFPRARRILVTPESEGDGLVGRGHVPPHRELRPGLEGLVTAVGEELATWAAPPDRDHLAPDIGEGIRLIGGLDDPATHRIRDLFARNSVPHRFLDPEAGRDLAGADPLPVLLTGDGQRLSRPSLFQIAVALGEPDAPKRDSYDLVVVGGGPAGLAAAVNGASEGLSTLIVERLAPGGQAGTSSRIENYVGFPVGLSGAELASRAFAQAGRLGADTFGPIEVVRIEPGARHRVVFEDGGSVLARAVVLALGVSWNRLQARGAERFEGRGLYYGSAMAVAHSLRDAEVVVVGGANSAGQAAVFFADVARRVRVLVRGPSLAARMSTYLVDRLLDLPNVEVLTETTITELAGRDRLERVLAAGPDGAVELPADAVLTFIGARPDTGWLEGVVARDPQGFLVTGPDLATDVPGIFAVGDVRRGSIKRVSSAVGEGSVVIPAVHAYLSASTTTVP